MGKHTLVNVRKSLAISLVFLFAVSLTAATVAAVSEAEKNEILNAHNKYRAEVGVSPLVWDDQLAASAQQWADNLNSTGSFEHSRSGENLIQGNFGGSWTNAIDFLGSEKNCFKNGVFPDIYNGQCDDTRLCRDYRDWRCSGHYSQIIWSSTQRVGGGKSGDYWVLHYSPPGNTNGQMTY